MRHIATVKRISGRRRQEDEVGLFGKMGIMIRMVYISFRV